MSNQKEIKTYKVNDLDYEKLPPNFQNPNQYVFAQSSVFEDVFGEPYSKGVSNLAQIEGIVVLRSTENRCKKAYLKMHGFATESSNIQLAYRAKSLLGGNDAKDVTIKKAKPFFFLLYHPEASIRTAFRFAIVIATISILLGIAGILF